MAADGSNMIYNLPILHKVTSLPFMNARMLRMSSPYIVKHVHVVRIFISFTYEVNTSSDSPSFDKWE